MQRALNAMLPPDIRALAVKRMPPAWNVRYAASKEYRYSIHTEPVADPFTCLYRHHPRWPGRLDFGAMAEASQLFEG